MNELDGVGIQLIQNPPDRGSPHIRCFRYPLAQGYAQARPLSGSARVPRSRRAGVFLSRTRAPLGTFSPELIPSGASGASGASRVSRRGRTRKIL